MKRNRTLIISALLASLGPLVGNGLYAVPGSNGGEILAEARDGLPAIAYVAFPLELIGFAALVRLLAWLVAYLFERAPVAAVTTGIAGSAMIAVKVGSVGPWMVVNSMPDKLDPMTAEMLIFRPGARTRRGAHRRRRDGGQPGRPAAATGVLPAAAGSVGRDRPGVQRHHRGRR